MINVLIVRKDLESTVDLMNSLCKRMSNFRVCNICTDTMLGLEILNSRNNIDVVLIDYSMVFCHGTNIFEFIYKRNKYVNSFIILTDEPKHISKEKNRLINTIILNSDTEERKFIDIKYLVDSKEAEKQAKNIKKKILNEINYLGFNLSYKGTQYLIKAIEYVAMNQDKDLDKLERQVYPVVSEFYHNTVHNIKCNINRANNIMYYECEIDKLQDYFCLEKDVKPKVKTVINTIVNKIS